MVKLIKLFDNNNEEILFNIPDYISKLFPLDNFSSFGFLMDGEYFQTSEHAFQYLKFKDTNRQIANEIKNAKSPDDARKIAHENKEYKLNNWSEVKYINMKKVLMLKVEENPLVKEALLQTKDYKICEFCVDEDTDWGIDSNNNGSNHLGNIWMEIRSSLRGDE